MSGERWVNVYDVTRCWGGPEEGGWWYHAGDCIEAHHVGSRAQAEALQDELRERYPRTGKRYSVLGGDDWDVRIELEKGTSFPSQTPRYE